MLKRLCAFTLSFGVLSGIPVIAQGPERVDTAMNAKIRVEGLERSKAMWLTHQLTDVYGPRPLGSPNHVAAANWAMKTMASWGMKNAHLEPFTWRGVGWRPGRASGFITAPVTANLKFEAAPWSPSTKGTVKGVVVSLVPPEAPTAAELTAFLSPYARRVKGHIVMTGAPQGAGVNFKEPGKRVPDERVRAYYARRPASGAASEGGEAKRPEGPLSEDEVETRVTAFLRNNLPALRIISQEEGRTPGTIVSQNRPGQIYDDTTPQPPAVILRADDFGRIHRIIADGTPVTVEFNIQNRYFPAGSTSYNVVADIPGTDKSDEVVMMGGHLDSWASATGATDNAIGCAIMMESARILLANGVKPRRTIRVALWGGEEVGEFGSTAYVKEHFGTAEAPTKDFGKLSAYWNIDEGTGRVRGASIFGTPEAASILAQYFKPFEEWGIFGARATSVREGEGSDHDAFVMAGLPGIGTLQDPIEYFSTTWHSNLDTYERVVPEDVMHNAVITASLMFHLANRDDLLPRFAPAPCRRNRQRGTDEIRGPAAARYFARMAVRRRVRSSADCVTSGGQPNSSRMVKLRPMGFHGVFAAGSGSPRFRASASAR